MREEPLHVFFDYPRDVATLSKGSSSAAKLDIDKPADIANAQLRLARLGQAQLSVWQARTAKHLMLENLGRGIQISAVARGCCLSRSHFSRAFKNTTGHSPQDWLRLARLERARELLEQTLFPITQVGLDCGFADQAHFTRTFSKAFGMPPKKWRALLKPR